MGTKGRLWVPFISSALCDLIWVLESHCRGGSWLEAVSAPSQGDSESQCLTVLAGDLVSNKQLMLRQSSAWLCPPICYHGTAPAQGEMPALIGQKCQGEISLDGRTQLCCESPVLCKNSPLQPCVMQELGFFPFAAAGFPLKAAPPTLQSQGWPQAALPPSAPPAQQQPGLIWLHWMISCVLRTSQECCVWWWYPFLLVLCRSCYFSHYMIIVLFLK